MAGVHTVHPRTERQIARVLAALKAEPMTRRALAEKLHMATTTAFGYLSALLGTEVYIAGYERTTRQWAPIYALGKKKNAPRPKRKTKRERYAAEKADPVKAEARRAYKRALYARTAAPRPPSLPQQITECLERNPRLTCQQIAQRLGANAKTLTTTLGRMRDAGRVKLVRHGTAKRAMHWQLVRAETAASEAPRRVVKTKWLASPIAQQGFFSALGI